MHFFQSFHKFPSNENRVMSCVAAVPDRNPGFLYTRTSPSPAPQPHCEARHHHLDLGWSSWGRLVDIGHWALRARIWTRSSVQQRLGNLVRVREDERGGEVPVIQIPLAPMTLFQSTLTALPPPNRSVTLVDTAIIVPSLSPVISALGKTKKK